MQVCTACFGKKITRFINSHSTATVNTFPNLSALVLLPRNAYFLPVSANLSPSLTSILHLIQPPDFSFYKILPVLNIMMTMDSLFLPKDSTNLLLKTLSSKLVTRVFLHMRVNNLFKLKLSRIFAKIKLN